MPLSMFERRGIRIDHLALPEKQIISGLPFETSRDFQPILKQGYLAELYSLAADLHNTKWYERFLLLAMPLSALFPEERVQDILVPLRKNQLAEVCKSKALAQTADLDFFGKVKLVFPELADQFRWKELRLRMTELVRTLDTMTDEQDIDKWIRFCTNVSTVAMLFPEYAYTFRQSAINNGEINQLLAMIDWAKKEKHYWTVVAFSATARLIYQQEVSFSAREWEWLRTCLKHEALNGEEAENYLFFAYFLKILAEDSVILTDKGIEFSSQPRQVSVKTSLPPIIRSF